MTKIDVKNLVTRSLYYFEKKKNSKKPKRSTIQLKNFTKNKKKANDAMYCREREGDKTI